MQFKLLELDISSGWFMIQTVFQGHLCNEKECEFFANPTLSCSFLYIPFESIQDLNQFRALKLMQSKCCTIQILHDPNFEWSKSCKIQIYIIQILHNPNSKRSKCSTIQILHIPNCALSKLCAIQILHDPNSAQSKYCTIQSLNDPNCPIYIGRKETTVTYISLVGLLMDNMGYHSGAPPARRARPS